MKIVLIATPIMDYNHDGQLIPIGMDALKTCPSYGLYLLAAVLQNKGYDVVLADLIAQGSANLEPYLADIDDCSLVGIGTSTLSWPTALDVIKAIRQIRKDVPIVLGGIHPTMFDRYILKKFSVQYVIRGEGESALVSICNNLENARGLEHVPNLSWINNYGEIVRNPIAPGISGDELGSLPLPDYQNLPLKVYHYLPIESSRGCANDCSFCGAPYRRSWRFISAERFVDRLETTMKYIDRTISEEIQIVDDEFSMDPTRAIEIARTIRERGLRPKIRYSSRATDILVDGFVENIADITRNIFVGDECGYDEGLKYIGKGITCQIQEAAARKLEENDISERAIFSFIIGLPWETRLEVEKTIHFAFDLISNYGISATIQWYIPIPGSRLWHKARKSQIFNESMYDSYGFAHDIYLFRGGLKLKPKEIWDISDILMQYKHSAKQHHPDQEKIYYTVPEAMTRNFPRELLSEEGYELANLRELYRSVH